MAGILNNKSRIFDNVVTEIGRSQIATGKMRIEYASLTDAHTYYESDAVSGSSDATNRLYFEAAGSQKQDIITFETDDSGQLLGYPNDGSLTLKGGEIFKKDGATSKSYSYVSSSLSFASLASGLITSSIDNFKQLYSIGSVSNPEKSALNRKFSLSTESIEFFILNTHPFIDGPSDSISNIDSVEPLFIDKRLSHIPNFKFLPPMIKEPSRDTFNYNREIAREAGISLDSTSDRSEITKAYATAKKRLFLGDYISLSEAGLDDEGYTYLQLMTDLNGEESGGVDPDWAQDIYNQNDLIPVSEGERKNISPTRTVFGQETGVLNLSTYEVARDRRSIYFTETSLENNLVMQMFEVNADKNTFQKLDIIDFGEFNAFLSPTDFVRPNKRVFFAGKIYEDSVGIPTFVNLFTIMLD